MTKNLREGTFKDRCDFCEHFDPYSFGRITGWCKKNGPKIDFFLAANLGPGLITAYNELCDEFERIE